MKKMRKFISVVLSVAMILSCTVVAFAEEATTATTATGSLPDITSDRPFDSKDPCPG